MNIETIQRHLREIDKLIDILDIKLYVQQKPVNIGMNPVKIDTQPVANIPEHQFTQESVHNQALPEVVAYKQPIASADETKTVVFSDTSITQQTHANIDELRDVTVPVNVGMTPVIRPEIIPIHMNGGGKISRDKQKSDDIYYTISILDLATK